MRAVARGHCGDLSRDLRESMDCGGGTAASDASEHGEDGGGDAQMENDGKEQDADGHEYFIVSYHSLITTRSPPSATIT